MDVITYPCCDKGWTISVKGGPEEIKLTRIRRVKSNWTCWRLALPLRIITVGKFDWGIRSVIIFLYVQFWFRLAAVSYRGKKVRTVVSSVVRSVNKSRGTRNCVQNVRYAICVIFTTRLYYKALGIILWALICKSPQLQSSWRLPLWRYRSPHDVCAGHGRCHGDNPWKFRGDVIVWGTKIA